jgi:hypothetical protein
MQHDSKIAVVLRDDLLTWQKLNVTSFLVSGITSTRPDLLGDPYEDASGERYLPMFAIPVVVLAADRPGLRRAFDRARARQIPMGLYTDDLFATGNDVDNRAAVRKVETEDLALAGIALAGDRRDIDKALDKLALHP